MSQFRLFKYIYRNKKQDMLGYRYIQKENYIINSDSVLTVLQYRGPNDCLLMNKS